MTTESTPAKVRLSDKLGLGAEARWYCVSRDGLATLCKDEADAHETVAGADKSWPLGCPHNAVQLVDAAAVTAWQPIATAPDGAMLLFADMQADEVRHWVFCGWRHSGLRGNSVQMPNNTARSATHWTAVPAPPRRPNAAAQGLGAAQP